MHAPIRLRLTILRPNEQLEKLGSIDRELSWTRRDTISLPIARAT
jgi:hypothetical protein